MPGFAQPVRYDNGAFGVDDDGIVIYQYDWERDKNQMNVLTKLYKRNPDALVEVFSNSPPYFMTWSGCSSGGAGEHKDNNLRPEYVPVFAEFLADVVKHLRDDLHIKLWGESLNNDRGFPIMLRKNNNYIYHKLYSCFFWWFVVFVVSSQTIIH